MARDIDDLDFNSLRNKIIKIIGNGSGQYGYGQTIQSSAVFEGNIVSSAQWNGLRYDLLNILIHQTGSTPSITEIIKGQVIRQGAGDPIQEYDRIIDAATFTRFELAPSQSLVTAVSTKNYSSAWTTQAQMTAQLNFGSADAARFFFNSGGKINFVSSRSGGSSTAQNNAWTNVLNNAGTISFGGDSENLDFYTLTNFYQVRELATLSTPYSANNYKIEALCNVANNSAGTATSITFRITWLDSYSETFPNTVVAPADQVDGTLSLSIEEVKASGNLQPTGSFTITSPSYTISNITAS